MLLGGMHFLTHFQQRTEIILTPSSHRRSLPHLHFARRGAITISAANPSSIRIYFQTLARESSHNPDVYSPKIYTQSPILTLLSKIPNTLSKQSSKLQTPYPNP
jgi:hypothetical protein